MLTILFRRRALIAAFFIGVVGMALAVLLLSAPVYESAADILVKKGRAEVPVAAKESPALIIQRVTEQDLNSEVEILRSRWLVEETLEALYTERGRDAVLDPPPPLLSAMQKILGRPVLSAHEWLVVELQKKLEIAPLGKSNLIRVSYRSPKPEWASDVVNHLTRIYLDRRADVFDSGGTVDFFQRQMDEAKGKLELLEARIREYTDLSDITMVTAVEGAGPMAAQKEILLKRIAELERQLADSDTSLRVRENKVTTLTNKLKDESERLPSANRTYRDSGIEELEKALVSLRLKRDELKQDFSADGRFMRDIESQIASAETQLGEAMSRAGEYHGTEANPVHQTLKTELFLSQTELAGFRARSRATRGQIETAREELAALNRQGFEVERLLLEARTAQDAYLLFQKKHEEARISSAMDEQKIVNVSIAQPAERPLRPVGMPRALKLLIALVFGLLGSLAAAFSAEFLASSFVTGQDVERRLGLSHLGSISESDPKRQAFKKASAA